jgi:hypothetical protein
MYEFIPGHSLADLEAIPCWERLSFLEDSMPNLFIAHIGWEFLYRPVTRYSHRSWTTYQVSEYVTRKIRRFSSRIARYHIDQGLAGDPPRWWQSEWMRTVFLGIGPWPVLDDYDDNTEANPVAQGISSGGNDISFGLGPWPRGDGTG